jgi:hypothetical protein
LLFPIEILLPAARGEGVEEGRGLVFVDSLFSIGSIVERSFPCWTLTMHAALALSTMAGKRRRARTRIAMSQ